MNEKGLIIIYNNNVEVKLIDNNVWMNQDQLISLYQVSKSSISEHIKHILEEGELDKNKTVRKFRIVQNKMHWAAYGHTAAEIIKERV